MSHAISMFRFGPKISTKIMCRDKTIFVYVLVIIALFFCFLNIASRKARLHLDHDMRQNSLLTISQEPAAEITATSFHPNISSSNAPKSVTSQTATPTTTITSSKRTSTISAGPPKIILFWTRFFGGSNSYMGEEGDRIRLKQCPVSNCILSEDKSLAANSSALFFHPMDFSGEIPPVRGFDQYYVYFVLESPPHTVGADLPNFFNLTFTYRFDSDIIADNYLQYFQPQLFNSRDDFSSIWKKKKFGAAAMISNCGGGSNRMDYIHQVQQYFPVDVYGLCGNFSCMRGNRTQCDSTFTPYKFYFAFENSICKDYITEKAIRGYMTDAVPVFMGGANYSKVFPPKSFLDVMDYESPKKLAEHLIHLAENEDAYHEFFKWRYDPKLVHLPDYLSPANVSLCKLCEMVNADEPIRKTYPNMANFWNPQVDCHSPSWTNPAPVMLLTQTATEIFNANAQAQQAQQMGMLPVPPA